MSQSKEPVTGRGITASGPGSGGRRGRARPEDDAVIGRAFRWDWYKAKESPNGQTVIMGRTSFEIFGPDLTTTRNIVVSRSIKESPGATVAPGIDEAVATAESIGNIVFSAGGASIYRQTMPLADKMYLSTIKGDFTGDAWFPEFSDAESEVEKEEDQPRFRFIVWRRRASDPTFSPSSGS
ncbi:MAG: dihydrofolate reductase [bacterium]|nr:dihydrofolate reductase [bacterium]